MSTENPLIPDPALERLARFSPRPIGFDRDELLFQAGKAAGRATRASVHPWKAVAALLLVTQTLTMGLWMASPGRPPGVVVTEKTVPEVPPTPKGVGADPEPTKLPVPYSYAALRWRNSGTMPETHPVANSAENGHVLTVTDIAKLHFVD